MARHVKILTTVQSTPISVNTIVLIQLEASSAVANLVLRWVTQRVNLEKTVDHFVWTLTSVPIQQLCVNTDVRISQGASDVTVMRGLSLMIKIPINAKGSVTHPSARLSVISITMTAANAQKAT